MTFVDGRRITATGTGASDHIFLHEKENGHDWTLSLASGTWGSADLQASADGTNWGDVKDSAGTVINHTANGFNRVAGNMFYRLDVNTYSADITLIAS